MDLAGGVEADGGAVDDEVAGRDGDGRARIGAGDVERQDTRVGEATVDDRTAGVGIGGRQGGGCAVKSGINQASRRAEAVVDDAGVEGYAALIDEKEEGGHAGGLRAARRDTSGADRLAGEITPDGKAAGCEVKRVVDGIREGQGLIDSTGDEDDGIREIGASRASSDVRDHKVGAGNTQILRGDTRAGRDDGRVIACVTRLIQVSEATGEIARGRSHVAGEFDPVTGPRDDVVDQQGCPICDDHPPIAAHLSVDGGVAPIEHRGVVIPREVTNGEDHRADDSVARRS